MEGRVDAHQHFWRYSPSGLDWIAPGSILARDYEPHQLRTELDDAGIAGSIVVQARQTLEETRWLLRLAEQNPWIVGVVGWIDLRSEALDGQLTEFSGAARLLGFRHVVQDEADPRFLLDPAFQRGVRKVLSAGFAYDLLIKAPQLEHVPAFLDAVGPGRIVLDHGAKPAIAEGEWEPWASRVAAIAERYPIYCKLSGLVTEADPDAWVEEEMLRYMGHLLDRFGPRRMIFGSDWPVCLLAASYHRVHALVERFLEPLCAQDRAAIMGGNALRAYARLDENVQGETVQ
ncbi:MAG TPA: amidohydrolase family protein [Novosphingobium sp.]|nr:amidohydrolase family protein [Novosphingobium sp.]